MSYYFLEIGSEEIPAGFIGKSCDFLRGEFEKQLKENNIAFGSVTADGTPRRMYVYVTGIAEKQADSEEFIMGPPASIAYDADGNLTKAGQGFAASKGIKPEDLKRTKTDKGEYISGVKKSVGVETAEVLKDLVPRIIKSIPFQKSMRWGSTDFRFARPVHWFISLFGGEVLPFEIDGIQADRFTYGHRIMCPSRFEIKDYDSYVKTLADARVTVNTESRKEQIMIQIKALEEKHGFRVDVDPDLLDTVSNLVEAPVAVLGSFSEDFLKLPPEVLITSMKNHQKYFYVNDKNGKLLNYFIGISNTEPENTELIRKGYARVLRARLTDAKFFYENDINVPLSQRTEELRKVVYQEKLGTSYAKMERFRTVAAYLAETLDNTAKANTDRAAYLCKADLLSEMVYEFPELQGIMGREYAALQKEEESVVKAIFEHYLPRFAGDRLPETAAGSFVSMADKLDTVCGCFAVGLIPSGSNDPYALRRSTIGILQIIRTKGYRLDLGSLIEKSLSVLAGAVKFDAEKTAAAVKEFILQRLKQLLVTEGVDGECFDAASGLSSDVITLEKAARALAKYRNSAEFGVISQGYKRINNILKKQEWNTDAVNPALFEKVEEKALADLLAEKKQATAELINKEDFETALSGLLAFSKPVDAFFEAVMVMAEDEKVKNNRLSLLTGLRNIFGLAGDLSKLA
ncbi:glycine--tRNA ligase subunit beta [Geovibrio thiophilus]|uniref:Glycine--tRNA ligase beta subunit n=1 Tax=Geovibrio thiophilus TaxID=139438 RepID=A0A3R6AW43_9BACT|nr:glycine--tRNA ligase subunit beta [Geovibrio thiophilus]QAR31879.1 glycine--tRNA ligase subunit beta [Geovibrio thiophilus]